MLRKGDGRMDRQTAREFLQHWIDQADDTKVVGFVAVLQMVIEQQRGEPKSARAIEKDILDGFGPRIPAAESYAKQGSVPTVLLTCGWVVDFEELEETTIGGVIIREPVLSDNLVPRESFCSHGSGLA